LKTISGNTVGMYMLGFNNRFALTGFSGASFIYPYVNNYNLSLYVDDVDFWFSRLELKRVDSGENAFLIKPYDEGVFYNCQKFNNIPVVSNIQLYLDLKTMGGRGQDAAEELLNEVIVKKW
jgi:hypothetical protein